MTPFKKEYLHFLTVCETLNFSRAAEKLDIGQAGLSKSVSRLEEDLGERLFLRKGRGLELTEFGQSLAKKIEQLRIDWQDGLAEMAASKNEIRGVIKIGAHPTVAIDRCPEFFTKLSEDFPDLELKLIFATSYQLTQMVNHNEIDIGLIINPIPYPELVVKKLKQEHMAIYASLKASKEVLYYNSEMQNVLKHLKKFSKFKQVPVDDYEVLAALAKSSRGYALLPSPVAERHRGLKQQGKSLQSVDLALVYRSDRPKTVSFRTVIETISKTQY